MLDTDEADEETDWVPDVDVGLEPGFFDLPDMTERLFSYKNLAPKPIEIDNHVQRTTGIVH